MVGIFKSSIFFSQVSYIKFQSLLFSFQPKMPFPDDATIMKTAGAIVEGFQGVFGKHPGMRPGELHCYPSN